MSEASASANPPPQKLIIAAAIGATIIVALGVGVWVSSRKAAPEPAQMGAPSGRDVPFLDGKLIRYSATFAQRVNLETSEVGSQEIEPLIEVAGKASYDPRKYAIVGARIEGRVRAILKYAGEEVKAGDVLAELESAELGRAQAEVLKMRAREEAATADEMREARLAEAKVSSVRDAELARATAVAARAERLAAENSVRALGGEVDAREVGVLRLRSPIAGKVVSMSLSRGQIVNAQTSGFAVADLSTLWVNLDVFEQEVGAVRLKDSVEITPLSSPTVKLRGTVAHVSDVINEESRSAEVRVDIDNKDLALRPGQGVRGKIAATGPKASALSVPLEAVTRVDGRATVFVATEKDAVEVRPVVLGPQGHSHVAVMSGLKEGERVVTQGVFALKSEIFR